MSTVLLEDTSLTNIANAIRDKLGVTTQYFPSEMAPAILTIPTSSSPGIDWGSEDEIGDITWWQNLRTAVEAANTNELAECVGKQKKITMSAVLGTTIHYVRCVGYNVHRSVDAPTVNTLTFETSNCLASTIKGASISSGVVYGSEKDLRNQNCALYLTATGLSDIVVQVGLKVKITTGTGLSNAIFNAKCFLLSDAEHGFIAGQSPLNGQGYAVAYDEFDQYNTSKIVPQYYNTSLSGYSKSRLFKNKGDSGSRQEYWERSRAITTSNICTVQSINSEGRPSNRSYDITQGLAPAFVI